MGVGETFILFLFVFFGGRSWHPVKQYFRICLFLRRPSSAAFLYNFAQSRPLASPNWLDGLLRSSNPTLRTLSEWRTLLVRPARAPILDLALCRFWTWATCRLSSILYHCPGIRACPQAGRRLRATALNCESETTAWQPAHDGSHGATCGTDWRH